MRGGLEAICGDFARARDVAAEHKIMMAGQSPAIHKAGADIGGYEEARLSPAAETRRQQ